jgi:hypothetical protein
MPAPGFYNDNEYRAYPFIYVKKQRDPILPNSAVVDMSITLGLTALEGRDVNYSVWLDTIHRGPSGFTFTFKYGYDDSAPAAQALVFFRRDTEDQWAIEYADSAAPANVGVNVCNTLPVWSGFIVTGPLTDLRAAVAVDDTLTFGRNAYQLEPARIQDLHKSYLRSITLGNYERTRIPACDSTAPDVPVRNVIRSASCMVGDIRFKAGYNCEINQVDRDNQIIISAVAGGGAPVDSALCANGSEIPLFAGETLPPDSKFFSGGPACDELITTINGLAGTTINFVGGNGVTISTADGQIKITKRANSQTNCAATP